MLLVLIACSCAAIIKASLVLFKYPILSHPNRSSLALPIVCLKNCPCYCFCVFLSFFSSFCTYLVFLYLHLFLLYMQQLTISHCCFLHNFLTQNCCLYSILDSNPLPLSLLERYSWFTLLLGWNQLCIVSNFLVLLSITPS